MGGWEDNAGWQLVMDVSGQLKGPIIKPVR
jgi:hypothetical protein